MSSLLERISISFGSCPRRSPEGLGPKGRGAYAPKPLKGENAGAAVGIGLAGTLVGFIISKSFLPAGGGSNLALDEGSGSAGSCQSSARPCGALFRDGTLFLSIACAPSATASSSS